MAKQGSIKHYRQTGTAKTPPSLPYGELAVAKDGTVFAGNSANVPVEVAGACMPRAGGIFTGDVWATYTNRATACLRNIEVRAGDIGGAAQSTNLLLCIRK